MANNFVYVFKNKETSLYTWEAEIRSYMEKSNRPPSKLSLKMTKKEIIEKAIKNFLPEGTILEEGNGVSEAEYKELEELVNAEEFSLNFKIFLGKVVHITDGDTIKVAIKLGEKPTRFTFRLSGIDTP